MDTINLNQSGIYAITSPSGKRYIGSAVSLRKRWNLHKSQLLRGKHHCAALQRAYNKYGDTLEYSVLVLCPKEELLKEEQRQMDLAGAGTLYNTNPVAGSRLGVKSRPETCDRIRAAAQGKRLSTELKKKIHLTRTGNKAKNNTSGYVGVTYSKHAGRWRAQRRIYGKFVLLGYYPTAELAHQARQNFDRILDYYTHS